MSKSKSGVRFNQHNVRNLETGLKARVWYSLDNRTDRRKCVTIYDKDYGHALSRVFAGLGAEYKNDTDISTDYFDKGKIVIFEGDAMYTEARASVEKANAARQATREAKRARDTMNDFNYVGSRHHY